MKRPWTRAEKWLFAAPLLLVVTALVSLVGPKLVRQELGYPMELGTSPNSSLSSISLSGNGQILAARVASTPSATSKAPITYLWDARTLQPLPPFVHGGGNRQATVAILSPDAKTLAWNSDGPGYMFGDLKTHRVLWASKLGWVDAAFSPDSHLVALNLGSYQILQAHTGKLVTSWVLHPAHVDAAFQFSPRGHWFASVGGIPKDWVKSPNVSGEIELRRVTDWKVVRSFPLPNTTFIRFSPDERNLLAVGNIYDAKSMGSFGTHLRCFDVSTGRIKWEMDSRGKNANPLFTFIGDSCFSPDGKLVALIPSSSKVFLLDANTGEVVRTLSMLRGQASELKYLTKRKPAFDRFRKSQS